MMQRSLVAVGELEVPASEDQALERRKFEQLGERLGDSRFRSLGHHPDTRDQPSLHEKHAGDYRRCNGSVDSYDRNPDAVHGYFASWRCLGELADGGRMPPKQFLFSIVDDAWKLSLDVAPGDLSEEAAGAATRERNHASGEQGNFVASVLTINAVLQAETFVERGGERVHVCGRRAVLEFDEKHIARFCGAV